MTNRKISLFLMADLYIYLYTHTLYPLVLLSIDGYLSCFHIYSVYHAYSVGIRSHSVPPHELLATRLLCPRTCPGKNTGVGCHSLLQGIATFQRGNWRLVHLLHGQEALYHCAPRNPSISQLL